MCTVSYLPLKGGGYILTSNRDEAPRRNAIEIRRIVSGNQSLLFPLDPHAGGSWFCVSDHGKAACLLNGAHIPFASDPRYSHSRGKVLLDILQYTSIANFQANYDLSSTAPFTLILAVEGRLHELIWDGSLFTERHVDPTQPAFWSSVTLYPEDVRIWRKALFEQWLSANPDFDQIEIMQFHRYGSSDDNWNGFVMNRGERVKTLSISSVQRLSSSFVFRHTDLISGEALYETLDVIHANVAEA